jgi:hypothetical protein
MKFSLIRFIIILPAIVILCVLSTVQAQDAQSKVVNAKIMEKTVLMYAVESDNIATARAFKG